MPNPATIAEKIIKRANNGYLARDDYPAYALVPWEDRRRWSEYIKTIIAEVIVEELSNV